ncbi:PREDICTED: putative DUF21 domain-containing protein At1g03270-like [Fragaria vesca subsp. vesca]
MMPLELGVSKNRTYPSVMFVALLVYLRWVSLLFAGVMSGLTLGLMSLGLVDLETLQKTSSYFCCSGYTSCCLSLCFWSYVEALPIHLDKLFS